MKRVIFISVGDYILFYAFNVKWYIITYGYSI